MHRCNDSTAPICAFVLVLLSFCATAAAQSEPEKLEPIEVSAPPAGPAEDPTATSSTLVVDAKPGEFVSIGDVLRFAPGLQVRNLGGVGQRETIFLRGVDSQHVAVMFDGFRLNTAQGGGVDLSTVPLEHVGRVEIIRGAASAAFGSNAIGGAINFKFGRTLSGSSNALNVTAGSHKTLMGSATRSETGRSLTYLASVVHRQSAGDFAYVDQNGFERVRTNNDSMTDSVLTWGRVQLGRGNTLGWLTQLLHSSRGAPGPNQMPTPHARESIWRLLAGIFHQGRRASIDWDTRVSVHWSGHSYANDVPLLGAPVDNDNRNLAAEASGSLAWASCDWHLITARLTVRHDSGLYQRGEGDEKPLRLSGGLLLENDLFLIDGMLTVSLMVRLSVAERMGAIVVPKGGVVFRPWEHLSVRFNAARAYRLPTFDELYFDAETIRGNPKLEPEDAWSVDLGMALEWKWFSLHVTGFYVDLRNLIMFLPKTVYLTEADDTQSARSFGVESAVHVEPLRNLTLRASYTFTDARFHQAPNFRLPLRSSHVLGARLAYEFKWAMFWGQLLFSDAFPFDRYESNFSPHKLVLNAGASVDLFDTVVLTISLRNLTNRKDLVDSLGFPLPPFQALGTVGGRF